MKILIEESVLRQALEALNTCKEDAEQEGFSFIQDHAITALRTALEAAEQDNQRITELEAVIKSHGIPIKTMTGGVAHYCMKEEAFDADKTDLTKCPNCGGPADNGHDRSYPPSPYYCKKCMEELE